MTRDRQRPRCTRSRRPAVGWAVLVCATLLPQSAAAVAKGEARYVSGTLSGVAAGTAAPIALDGPEKLVFAPATGRVEIPWAAVTVAEYRPTGMVGRSRAGLAVITPYSLFFTKGRKHLVTLSFGDQGKRPQVAVFEFDKQDIQSVLSVIRLRTGKPVACEGEDVRNPLEGCSGPARPRLAERAPAPAGEPIAVAAPSTQAAPTGGTRVRIVAPEISDAPIQGEIVASDEATITIRTTHATFLDRTYGKTLSLPRTSVTRVERSVRGSRRPMGALVGAIIGTAAGLAVLHQSQGNDEIGQSGGAIGLFALPGALLGAAVAPGERWAAEDPGRIRVADARAMGRGVRLSLSVRF